MENAQPEHTHCQPLRQKYVLEEESGYKDATFYILLFIKYCF